MHGAWLRAALDAAGVELGTYDQYVVDLLAEDCATTVQVVAGWIARAADSPRGDGRRAKMPP